MEQNPRDIVFKVYDLLVVGPRGKGISNRNGFIIVE
jgi:hypothetical protein